LEIPPNDLDDKLLYSFAADVIAPPVETAFNRTVRCHFVCCHDDDHVHSIVDNDEMLECSLNHTSLEMKSSRILKANIQQHQVQQVPLMESAANPATMSYFPVKVIDQRPVICHSIHPDDPEELWKLCCPQFLFDLFLCGIIWFLAIVTECRWVKRFVVVSVMLDRKCVLMSLFVKFVSGIKHSTVNTDTHLNLMFDWCLGKL